MSGMRDLSKAVGYFRVSTQHQAEEYYSIENYFDRFIRFGFTKDKIYYDIASGGDSTRENYQKILSGVRQGLIKRVYVPEISRISRNIVHFQEVIEAFNSSSAELVTLDGTKFDFNTPTGSTNVKLMVLFAEQERLNNQYRSVKGYDYLRSQGRAIKAVFPYLKVDGYLVPNHNQYKDTNYTVWHVGQDLIYTYMETQNLSHTIDKMLIKYGAEKAKPTYLDFPRDHSSVRDWLKSEVIRGNTHYFGGRRYKNVKDAPKPIIVYNTHEPLISQTQHQQIDYLLNLTQKGKSTKIKNLWVGLMFCGVCGSPMKVGNSKTKYSSFDYLLCSSAYANSPAVRTQQKRGLLPKCKTKGAYGLTADKLDQLCILGLCQMSEELANTVFPKTEITESPEIKELREQIKLYSKLVTTDSDLQPILDKKQQRLSFLEATNTDDTGSQHQEYLRQSLIEFGADLRFWELASPAEKRLIYADFIKRIVCTHGEVAIEYKV